MVGGVSMSAGIFKRTRIFIPVCLFLVLAVVFSFLMMPGISSGNGISCTVTTMPATDITVNSAKLNGHAVCYVKAISENHVYAYADPVAGFVWGTNPRGPYPNMSAAQIIGANGFSTTLTGLNPFTTYYYMAYLHPLVGKLPGNNAVFADEAPIDIFVYGGELNFTTLGQNISSSPVNSGDAGMTVGIPAEVDFNYINLYPAIASVNEPVTVVANVVNRGSLEGGYTANLQINGHIEQSKMGTVAGNTYVPVQFTVVKDTPGTYSVDIGGQTATFTVIAPETSSVSTMSQSQIFTIILAILGIAAIGLLTAVIMRRRSGY
jgi:hypothetical protein